MNETNVIKTKKEEDQFQLFTQYLGPFRADKCDILSEVEGPSALKLLAILKREEEKNCFNQITKVVDKALGLREFEIAQVQNELKELMLVHAGVENYSRNLYNLVREITQHSCDVCENVLITNIIRNADQTTKEIEFLTFDKEGNLIVDNNNYDSPSFIPMDRLLQGAIYYYRNQQEAKSKNSNMVCLPDALIQSSSDKELLNLAKSNDSSKSDNSKIIEKRGDFISVKTSIVALVASLAVTATLGGGYAIHKITDTKAKAKYYTLSQEDQRTVNILKETGGTAEEVVEHLKILNDVLKSAGYEYNIENRTLKDLKTNELITLNNQ